MDLWLAQRLDVDRTGIISNGSTARPQASNRSCGTAVGHRGFASGRANTAGTLPGTASGGSRRAPSTSRWAGTPTRVWGCGRQRALKKPSSGSAGQRGYASLVCTATSPVTVSRSFAERTRVLIGSPTKPSLMVRSTSISEEEVSTGRSLGLPLRRARLRPSRTTPSRL